MATDKRSDASGIFSNAKVKQSMSSVAESPKAGERSSHQGLNLGQMKKEIMQDNASAELNRSHHEIYGDKKPGGSIEVDAHSASNLKLGTQQASFGGNQNQLLLQNETSDPIGLPALPKVSSHRQRIT